MTPTTMYPHTKPTTGSSRHFPMSSKACKLESIFKNLLNRIQCR